MAVPIHNEGCKTRLVPTKCPECGKQVYYFSCSCGSKVFFDLSEPPWNPHGAVCIPYLIRCMVEIDKVPESQIRSIVEEYSRTSGIPISPEAQRFLEEIDGGATTRLTIQDVPAEEDCRPALGAITSVNLSVNFFKRFSYTDNTMGRGLLGRLLKDSYVEIVIREDADESRSCNQYRAFQKHKEFTQAGVSQHSRVIATLRPHMIADGRRIWIVERIERVM
jgi:hypothetical protein